MAFGNIRPEPELMQIDKTRCAADDDVEYNDDFDLKKITTLIDIMNLREAEEQQKTLCKKKEKSSDIRKRPTSSKSLECICEKDVIVFFEFFAKQYHRFKRSGLTKEKQASELSKAEFGVSFVQGPPNADEKQFFQNQAYTMLCETYPKLTNDKNCWLNCLFQFKIFFDKIVPRYLSQRQNEITTKLHNFKNVIYFDTLTLSHEKQAFYLMEKNVRILGRDFREVVCCATKETPAAKYLLSSVSRYEALKSHILSYLSSEKNAKLENSLHGCHQYIWFLLLQICLTQSFTVATSNADITKDVLLKLSNAIEIFAGERVHLKLIKQNSSSYLSPFHYIFSLFEYQLKIYRSRLFKSSATDV
ncbi:hypothetical protein CANINC_000538 [Pichia inconspicua]|uniref:Uncharacterized protein n=1 Tax=Pichia inconspicua TaxID=52247 RepID=A0A4T0X7A1_9ASCO|nr:hypothetical protein CANINC_000538 [[Candida] inconspicua]